MDWQDLKLTKQHLKALRDDYGIDEPEQVVKLAWGAPDLLGNVLPDKEVERLRAQFSAPEASDYDSSAFELGAWFGGPESTPMTTLKDFESERSKLLDEIEKEHSPDRRANLEKRLLKLYERD